MRISKSFLHYEILSKEKSLHTTEEEYYHWKKQKERILAIWESSV